MPGGFENVAIKCCPGYGSQLLAALDTCECVYQMPRTAMEKIAMGVNWDRYSDMDCMGVLGTSDAP